MRSIIIDTDTGVDDALALLVLLSRADIDVVAVTSSFGNCSVHDAASNARYILELTNRADVPVAIGRAAGDDQQYADFVHGSDGLGELGLTPENAAFSAEPASEQILRIAHERPGEVELLTLGCVRNVADALRVDPTVLTRFRSVVIMGGMGARRQAASGVAGYQNYLAVGDPNMNSDAEAAEIVSRAEGPITWVGMDIGGTFLVPYALLEEHARNGSPQARFIHDATAFYSDFVTRSYGLGDRAFTVWDSIAAAVFLDPALIRRVERLPAAVHWDESGRASVWGDPAAAHGTAHTFVSDVDRDAVRRLIVGALIHDFATIPGRDNA
ncbi:purine nucleosidase [Microbacterium sp. W4I4]|uniref:nucleoside hydrolase n=1 Tax=Microbacterium sp. W4I4 TaxID=3042295 RepID=UPI00278B1BF4|nr:nucleoside hydrolase [Microbacterium sp. W4I4]MDQ0614069.1 purine nucleosidase [Microbacterium sp. W4I4]